MLNTWLQGLLFGVAYIAPIGLQNLYMINTALAPSQSAKGGVNCNFL